MTGDPLTDALLVAALAAWAVPHLWRWAASMPREERWPAIPGSTWRYPSGLAASLSAWAGRGGVDRGLPRR